MLAAQVTEVLDKYQPNTLAIEELFFSGNQKTAMRVSEVRGVVVYLGVQTGATIMKVTALQVKVSIAGLVSLRRTLSSASR